jgi:hypothetical protein
MIDDYESLKRENAMAKVARLKSIINELAHILKDGQPAPDAPTTENHPRSQRINVPNAPAPPKLERAWNAPIVGPGISPMPRLGIGISAFQAIGSVPEYPQRTPPKKPAPKAGDADICECHHEHAWHGIDELGKPWCLKCTGTGRYHVYKEAGRP